MRWFISALWNHTVMALLWSVVIMRLHVMLLWFLNVFVAKHSVLSLMMGDTQGVKPCE